MTFKAECPVCHRMYSGADEFSTSYARDEHLKYCRLSTCNKVLKYLLSPIALVGMIVAIPVVILYFTLYRVAYPFLFATSLFLDSEVYTWQQFQKDAGTYNAKAVKVIRKHQ